MTKKKLLGLAAGLLVAYFIAEQLYFYLPRDHTRAGRAASEALITRLERMDLQPGTLVGPDLQATSERSFDFVWRCGRDPKGIAVHATVHYLPYHITLAIPGNDHNANQQGGNRSGSLLCP